MKRQTKIVILLQRCHYCLNSHLLEKLKVIIIIENLFTVAVFFLVCSCALSSPSHCLIFHIWRTSLCGKTSNLFIHSSTASTITTWPTRFPLKLNRLYWCKKIKIQQKANKKPLELQAQGTDLKQLQGRVTCSFRETLEREKTPETEGTTVIRKAERHEGWFWHRLQPCRITRHWEEATAAFLKLVDWLQLAQVQVQVPAQVEPHESDWHAELENNGDVSLLVQ